jgi:hypothetical protein
MLNYWSVVFFWVMGEDFERIDGFFSAIFDG